MDAQAESEGVSRRSATALMAGLTLGALAPTAPAHAEVPTVDEHALRKLIIQDAVRQMRARYGWHAARGDYDSIADLFAPDGLFELLQGAGRQQLRGRETIRGFLAGNMTPGVVFPVIMNETFVVADDGQSVIGTCAMESRGKVGTMDGFLGYYHDKAVLLDEGWRFAERRFFFYLPVFERSGLDLESKSEHGLAAQHQRTIDGR